MLANGVRRMNERWRFQCDGGRRIEIKTALFFYLL
ncbi:hypothetical protein T4D_15967 [Trichinella pseudospiralis]|uniref:Uncharacterized protein n=1 Tax=Trichinella pseudospiralis TaxID=6337 RepID=A0A0V1DJT3_TRIPS|nr:hypothetical protein T4D_15967 [Trichinella pseudospiralis]